MIFKISGMQRLTPSGKFGRRNLSAFGGCGMNAAVTEAAVAFQRVELLRQTGLDMNDGDDDEKATTWSRNRLTRWEI
jgi:hypothetical protein